jgi:hypothetical protein
MVIFYTETEIAVIVSKRKEEGKEEDLSFISSVRG